ncbi:olfactory receptor 5V1-like [Tiliqua scincoides]|uniref:olfactory receptor 5V1-like n=1 Tax=Tiliqua scincoides TaxID=71010 RepID=UPI0034624D82
MKALGVDLNTCITCTDEGLRSGPQQGEDGRSTGRLFNRGPVSVLSTTSSRCISTGSGYQQEKRLFPPTLLLKPGHLLQPLMSLALQALRAIPSYQETITRHELPSMKLQPINKPAIDLTKDSLWNLENQTSVGEFILLGFSNHPDLQLLFFLVFSIIYTVTIMGNLMIILAIIASSNLHTPMYFLLGNLSFIDLCYMSATVPQMLVNFLRDPKTVSYAGCMAQIFLLISCVGSECILLAVMAYDRYVAICQPLLYLVLMNRKKCIKMVAGSWTGGVLNSLVHTLLTATLSFCGPKEIRHFMCDVPPLLELSCTNTDLNNTVLHTASVFIGISPCLFIIASYIFIASAIIRIRSAEGRRKAFSTCASHLTVVVTFFGTALFNYNRSNAGDSLDIDTLVSALYCIVTPMLNPIIYSLRNQEVKAALRKLMSRKWAVL